MTEREVSTFETIIYVTFDIYIRTEIERKRESMMMIGSKWRIVRSITLGSRSRFYSTVMRSNKLMITNQSSYVMMGRRWCSPMSSVRPPYFISQILTSRK